MTAGARVVTADTDFTWDGATQHLAKGTLIHVAPGSLLEAAIGPERLVPLFGVRVTAAPATGRGEAAPAPGPQPRPRARAAAKAGEQDRQAGSDATGER